MNPVINKIEKTQKTRHLFFFGKDETTDEERILYFNTRTREEKTITKETLNFNPDDILYTFWDPHTGKNYCFLQPSFSSYDNGWYEIGWYEMQFDREKASLIKGTYLYHGYDHARRCPFAVKLNKKHMLLAKHLFKEGARYEEYRVINIQEKKLVWEYSSRPGHHYSNVYWISGEWLFQEKTYHLGNVYDKVYHSLLNYKTEKNRSFAPDIIIGYGAGYIITTSIKLVGITVQDPAGNIIFKDNTYELTSAQHSLSPNYSFNRGGIPEEPKILSFVSFVYFDNRYIYYEVYTAFGPYIPYCTVIIDTNTLNTFKTSNAGDKLLAIF